MQRAAPFRGSPAADRRADGCRLLDALELVVGVGVGGLVGVAARPVVAGDLEEDSCPGVSRSSPAVGSAFCGGLGAVDCAMAAPSTPSAARRAAPVATRDLRVKLSIIGVPFVVVEPA